ncbi:MAG: hypothetical protein NXI22_02410, partial [bacterium]|nr:hypothetical protein [bacterium]
TSTSVNDEMVAQLFELNSLEQLVLEPISGNPKGFAESITEAIDYQLDDVPFSALIEFLEDYSGATVIDDEGLIDPNEVVSIGPEDTTIEAFFASRGLTLLCLRRELLITTPEDAAKRRSNLTELKRRNPRLQDIRVVYD